MEGLKEYGGKCACCGESKPEFLTLDHINGRGPEEKTTGMGIWYWLKLKGWPKDNYQILCWNCNCAKGVYGQCPHKKTG